MADTDHDLLIRIDAAVTSILTEARETNARISRLEKWRTTVDLVRARAAGGHAMQRRDIAFAAAFTSAAFTAGGVIIAAAMGYIG